MVLHDPVFRLGFFAIHPFGLFVAIGLLLGYVVTLWQVIRAGLSPRYLPGMLVVVVLGAFALARLGFAAQHPAATRDGAQSLLALWQGGLSLAAGVAGGALLLLLYTWAQRLPFQPWADALAPGAALGLAVGMLGLPYGGEGWGQPTRGPFFMRVAPSLRPAELVNDTRFQPIFAYEAIIFAVLALALVILARRRRRTGRPSAGSLGLLFLFVTMLGYGALRPLTLDASTAWLVTQTQVFCAVVAALAGALFVRRLRRARDEAAITREIEHAQLAMRQPARRSPLGRR